MYIYDIITHAEAPPGCVRVLAPTGNNMQLFDSKYTYIRYKNIASIRVREREKRFIPWQRAVCSSIQRVIMRGRDVEEVSGVDMAWVMLEMGVSVGRQDGRSHGAHLS